MKKILSFMLIATFMLALTACKEVEPDENELPTLAGIESSVTVNVGDTFDPLSGVTANDAEDGVLTSSITITGLDCLALGTDNVVPASAGGASCTLVYKVEDADGGKAQKNSVVTVEVVTDSTENALVNGDFELGSNAWANSDSSLVDLYNDAVGTGTVNSGVLEIVVTTPSWDGSAPRVNQEGIDYENGKTYEVSFDAKASEAAMMKSQVGVFLSAEPWFKTYFYNTDSEGVFSAFVFDLTTAWQTFTYKFTVVEATTDNGTITFEYGANADATEPITFYLDNVVIKEATPDPDEDAPVFSGLDAIVVGLADGFDPLEGVSFYDVDTTLTNADIVITHDGGTNVTLETDGTYSFAALGVYVFTYELTDADSNVASETRTVTVEAMVYDQPWNLFGNVAGVADEDSATLTYTSTPASWWGNNAQLAIERFDGTQTSIEITFTGILDHLYLFKAENVDGDFTEFEVTGTGAEQVITVPLDSLTELQRDRLALLIFFCKTEGATGTVDITHVTYTQKDYTEMWTGYNMTVVADYDSEMITYDNVGDPWWNDNAQLAVVDYDGTKEGMTFTFKGTEDQTYIFKVENAAGDNVETPVIATGAVQTVNADLSAWTELQRDTINLVVLFANEIGATGSIDVMGWDYTPEFVATWIGYGTMTVAADADSEMITYSGIVAGTFYNDNAQLTVTDFDGTNESITISFTGVLDHLYLFKIENGSEFVEAEATGTGAAQEVVLDLSGLTEAQRDALNLLIFFCKTDAAAGTADIAGWDYTSAP